MLPAADTCYQLFPSDNISKGIIIKHAFCLFCCPKLHAAREKNKEVREKLTLRNKLERRRLSILETADSGIISASNPASSIASIISST